MVAHYDPVCGKKVDSTRSEAAEYKHHRYFFCSSGCKQRFEHETERTRIGDLARMGALFSPETVRWGLA